MILGYFTHPNILRLTTILVRLPLGFFIYFIWIAYESLRCYIQLRPLWISGKKYSHFQEELFDKDNAYGKHVYIDVGEGRKIHAVESGNEGGDLVLFLHGFPQCWYEWRHQLKGLKNEGYLLVAIDLPGYGASYSPSSLSQYNMRTIIKALRQVIDHYGGKCAALVGHDLGGALAFHLAYDSWQKEQQQGEKGYIQNLIILNAPPTDLQKQNIKSPIRNIFSLRTFFRSLKHPRYLVPFLDRALPSLLQLLRSSYMCVFLLPYPLPEIAFMIGDCPIVQDGIRFGGVKNIDQDDLDRYKASCLRNGLRSVGGMLGYYRSGTIYNWEGVRRGELAVTGIDTLLIWGDRDIALQRETCLNNIVTKLPNVSVVRLHDAGHFVVEEACEHVNELIRKFLKR
ncbi:uncharacterized protein VTP21DRAFT_1958 [Calcarisporiella thermophila]|uniref:uncharacterized protein n=1 Tax=Calcarisporiella thermophila TaxID=911321 RepID=UPI003741F208